MKTRLHLILLILLIALMAPAAHVDAQDSGIMEVEYSDSEKDKLERDKIILSPGEADSRYVTKYLTTPKDTIATNRETSSPKTNPTVLPAQQKKSDKVVPTSKPAEKASQKQDDSILSFNFLYYIIEKYKLQDIVD
ncbi:MAG TPA: hypothetical protein VEB86_05045 [Chryseosolibacter sp.]|nr:hypothetical protein [Chryseosolibacter sp.]